MSSDIERYGLFAPPDAELPVMRGDMLDLMVTGTIASVVAPCVVCCCERAASYGTATADLILFDGIVGMLTTREALLTSASDNTLHVFRLPYSVDVWLRPARSC